MTMEFITYGGFDIIVKAFTAVALIFSDHSYVPLYGTLMIIGVVFIASQMYLGALTGGKLNINLFEWFQVYWWAIVFLYALIIPTGSLVVYDHQKNRQQIINDLPIGLVVVAGLTNKVEEGLKEIVDTAMAPLIGYDDAANGTGFDIYSKVVDYTSTFKWPDDYDRLTLQEYTDKCFKFAVNTGKIAPQELKYNNNFIPVFEKANNPAIQCLQYSAGNPQGAASNCRAVFNNTVKKFETLSYWQQPMKDFCTSNGFDANNANEFLACTDVIQKYADKIFEGGIAPYQVFSQMAIANIINNEVKMGDSSTIKMVGTRETVSGMTGAGIMANDFVPLFKNVLTAITIIMTPIVFLLLSIFGIQAFKYWLGSFILIMLWGVTDVVLHGFVQDYAYKALADIRQKQIGYDALFVLQPETAKMLGVLGYMRTLGIVISSIIVQSVMNFGGQALAQMAGSMQGKVDSAGNQAGHTALTTEGKGDYMKKLEGSMSVMANAERYNFNDRTSSMANLGAKTYGSGKGFEDQATAFSTGFTQSQGDVGTQKGIAEASANFGGVRDLAEKKALKSSTAEGQALSEFSEQTGITNEKEAAVRQGMISGTQWGTADATIGDVDRARKKASVETQNQIGTASADDKIAKKYGLTAEDVADLRRTKEGTAAPEMIKRHAERNGVTYENSASIIGQAHGAISEADLAKNAKNAQAWGNLRHGEDPNDGLARQTEFERNGLLTERMAGEANKALGFKDEKGPVKADMKVGGWGVNPETGQLMLDGATFQDKEGSVRIAGGVVTAEGTFNAERALNKADQLDKEGHGYAAAGLRNLVSKKDGGTAKQGTGITGDEAIQYREVLSMDGKSATFHAKHGTETEWKNLETRTSGTKSEELDINNRIKERRNEDTETNFSYQKFTTPTGMKEGYLAYDPLTKGPVMVSGNERYGVDKHIVTMDEKSGGVMLQDVTADPRTQKVVSGSQSSILVTKEAMKAEDGQTYNGTMFTDAKTGNKLFVDGHKGDMWTKVDNQGHGHWTVYRGYQKQGEFLPKVAGALFGETGASMMSDFLKGSGELAGLRGLGTGKLGKAADDDLSKGGKIEPK